MAARPIKVAALYVDRLGPYMALDEVDPWPVARDARLYAGPHPVIAHPPCGPWGKLRHMSTRDDPQLAITAVAQVRAYGGALEHPAHSKLWTAQRLPRPGSPPDAFGGYTIEICQCDFGHVARKRTWLYIVRGSVPPLPPQREPTHWISGGRGRGPGGPTRVPDGVKVACAEQRRRTPKALAHWLAAIAASAR